jgi:drug/metabolite transporter (DMT)-like permease
MNFVTWLMGLAASGWAWVNSSEGQAAVTLLAVAAVVIPYYWTSTRRRGECDMSRLLALVFFVVGIVAGVFLFINSFGVARLSPQNALWGGIAGIVLFLFSLEGIRKEWKGLQAQEPVKPKERVTESAVPPAPRPDPSGQPPSQA